MSGSIRSDRASRPLPFARSARSENIRKVFWVLAAAPGMLTRLFGLSAALVLAGCVALAPPDNKDAKLYDPEKSAKSPQRGKLSYVEHACPAPGTANFIMPAARDVRKLGGHPRLPPMRYSPGDRVNILVYGSQEFSGDYAVNADGTIILPYAGQINAVGLTNAELTTQIERQYLRAGIFTREGLKLTIRPVQFAPVNVTVSGAVFHPGRHAIGAVKDSDKSDRVLSKFGDSPMERFVPAALRAAGGIRPDADISAVKLVRNGKTTSLDWRGAFTGSPVDDMPLIDGDHIKVEEAGCYQSALVRPSQITPPGIRLIYSNLTQPAGGNAGTIQSYQFAGSVPYGTRLLQGLIQANCIGGSYATNARRYAVLISRNPKTQLTEVVQWSVEELVRSADRDSINPFLMPDDAIACYDSAVQEFREVLGLLQAVALPANTARGALAPR
ncbi:MAG: polysaccharide biosynthesis/export family protein [Hyphomicrobium sp.]